MPSDLHHLSVYVDGRRVLELDALRVEVKSELDVTRYPSISCDSFGFDEVLPKYVITAELPSETRFREHA